MARRPEPETQRPVRDEMRAAETWAPRGHHFFFLFSLAAAAFLVRSATPFSIRQGLPAVGLALLTTASLGWLIVTPLAAGLASRSVRAALIFVTGYVASIYLGYLLAYAGLPQLLLPLALAGAVVWVGARYRQARAAPDWRRGWAQALDLAALWQSEAVWVVLALACLSVCAAVPLLAPLERITPDLYMDYASIDKYYHIIRVSILRLGAPPAVWPDLAGVKPLVYPDFHHFWMAQLSRWSGAGSADVYFIYAPLVTIWFNVLTLYAVGRQRTGSAWGGYLAAAMAVLVLIPNPYDPNLRLRHEDVSALTAYRIHYDDLQGNLNVGAGWLLISAVALALGAFRAQTARRAGIGLLVVAGVILAALIRIRPHFLIAAAPLFVLIVLGQWVRRRRWAYLIPLAAFAAALTLIYAESASGNYDAGTSELIIVYGLWGERAASLLPAPAAALLRGLPAGLQPALALAAFAFAVLIGFANSLIVGVWVVDSIRRRRRPVLEEWFLYALLLAALAAASFIALDAWREGNGNWGGQVLSVLPRVGVLLAIYPLYVWGQALPGRFPGVRANGRAIALGAVLAFTVIAFRGAQAALHSQSFRAYPLTREQVDTYYWIKQNTPALAVVAADPRRRVNLVGETVETTNFLSGMTDRPAYLQRVVPINVEETQRRRALLISLFTSHSAEEVTRLLQSASFDYLLVYSDTPAAIDLACCLELVRDGDPQVFQVVSR